MTTLAKQLLCLACTLLARSCAAATADTGGGRELLQSTNSVTITAGVQDACENSDYWSPLDKNAAGYRGACATNTGVNVPCLATASDGSRLNFSVNQGESLTVLFKGTDTTYVFLGGSLNDGFTNGAGCFTKTTTAAAQRNSITANTLTGFTFAPTGAVCSQFVNNVQGTFSVLAFDTYYAESRSGAYYAAACKFDVGVNIIASPSSQLSDSQLFPLTGGADTLSGSVLKMLGAAVLGALMLIALLH